MIKLDNVVFSYRKNTNVINSLSINIDPGELVGILGHNGAGKTTLFRIILGLLKPQCGTVIVGYPNNVGDNKGRVLSFMPENNGIYERLSAYQNLFFRARIAQKNLNIADTANSLLQQLRLVERANEQVLYWSNGMKKRLSLACALISQPKILMLDEPTNGIDPESLEIITNMLRELNNTGVTILINSHDLNLVQELCSRVIILQNGKLLYNGSFDEKPLKQLYLGMTNERSEND